MSEAAAGRRARGPGRLDPTVRALLRAFLSPAVADRYASALQPIAVADRDAALAGAVSTLRTQFFVLPEELAVALVEDAGWTVADVSTMLGMPTIEVRAALREAAGGAEPRIGATPPEDLDGPDGDAAAVDAMLADLPTRRRDAGRVAAEVDDTDPVDVELSTALPGYIGLPTLEEQVRRSDRLQRIVVNATVIVVLTLVAAAIAATRPSGDDVVLPDDDGETVAPTSAPTPGAEPPTASPTATPSPTTSPSLTPAVRVGPPRLAEARFVASVDPASGDPGPTLDPATIGEDPRLWLRLDRLPAREFLLTLRFTAPSGRSTVRPVLVTDRTPLVSVRLPDELGREAGRYAARIEAEGMDPTVVELELVEPEQQ